MKAVWYAATGPAREVLSLGQMPTPLPGAEDVLVRLRVSGAGLADAAARAGASPMEWPRVVPHQDGAGVIEAVGRAVPPERINQRVWLWNAQAGRPLGTAAEYVALPAAQAVPLPHGTSFAAGACLGTPAMTVLHALLSDGGVEGQAVLLAGGGEALLHYGLQFARLLGARLVVGTAATPQQAARAMAMGADACLPPAPTPGQAAELTEGEGFRRIIAADLGAVLPHLPALLAPGGLCTAHGSATPAPALPFDALAGAGMGLRLLCPRRIPTAAREVTIAWLDHFLAQGGVRHPEVPMLPLSACAEAHERLEAGEAAGHILLDVAA